MSFTSAITSLNEASVQTEAEGNLILPNQNEQLMTKIRSFQRSNIEQGATEELKVFIDRTSRLFIQICKEEFSISLDQLRMFSPDELINLARLIYDKSKIDHRASVCWLSLIPFFGWLILLNISNPTWMGRYASLDYGQPATFKRARYRMYFKKIEKIQGRFMPNLTISSSL